MYLTVPGGALSRASAGATVLAARHAQAVSLLVGAERSRVLIALGRALSTWVRVMLAQEKMEATAARGQLAAARPQMQTAVAQVQRDGEMIAEAEERRIEAEQRAVRTALELERTRAALDAERQRSAQAAAEQREEAQEVCRAAAQQCERARADAGEARAAAEAAAERNQHAILHWCAGHILVSLLRSQSLAAASRAVCVWRAAIAAMSVYMCIESETDWHQVDAVISPPQLGNAESPSLGTSEE